MQSNNEWMYWGELAHEIYPVGGGERIASFPSKEQAERVISLHNKALRAQADARPVAWRVGSVIWPQEDNAKIFARDTKQGIEPLFTHPEASAPGLSEDEWLALAERHIKADWNSEQPDGYLNAVKALAQDAMSLTRASAATVDEPDTDRDENLCQSCVDNRGELSCTAGPQCVAISNPPLKSVPCTACELNGVYSTDGEGPFDCYKCGKKATPQQFETNRDIQQLADWLLVEPTNGERLHFAGPLERDFLGLSRVKMVSASGSIWTLTAGLKEDYKTNSQRLHNIREAAQNSELSDEKRVMQLAAISTAAAGYWKEGDSIHPDYDSTALRDTAKLYEKYDELFKAAQQQAEPGADEREREALAAFSMLYSACTTAMFAMGKDGANASVMHPMREAWEQCREAEQTAQKAMAKHRLFTAQSGERAGVAAADYEEVLADHRRLVRELDVLLNGEAGAAKQASLCDIVAQVQREGIKAGQRAGVAERVLDWLRANALPNYQIVVETNKESASLYRRDVMTVACSSWESLIEHALAAAPTQQQEGGK